MAAPNPNGGVCSTALQFRHIFGVNTNVVDNLSYTDDDTIVYVAGHSLVLYSFTEKRQRFIQSSEITESITAYTSGPGKRCVYLLFLVMIYYLLKFCTFVLSSDSVQLQCEARTHHFTYLMFELFDEKSQ